MKNMGSTKEFKIGQFFGSFRALRRECPWGLNNASRFLELHSRTGGRLKGLAPVLTG